MLFRNHILKQKTLKNFALWIRTWIKTSSFATCDKIWDIWFLKIEKLDIHSLLVSDLNNLPKLSIQILSNAYF